MSDIENLKVLSTGFTELDTITTGLHKSSLNVIAGRPTMGKTTLAFNIAVNVAQKEKVPVAIFSLEMSKEQVVSIIIGSEATKKLSDTEIYIDDTPGISVDEIREKCIKLKQEKNLGLVIIDYIQLVSANKETSREQELSSISRSLKNLSQELNIPILITSQLSKTADIRYKQGQNPRPTFKDLKYSGALIQNASTLLFLYRDDYYYPDSEKRDIAEINVAKNRFGKLGTVELFWFDEYCKFANKN